MFIKKELKSHVSNFMIVLKEEIEITFFEFKNYTIVFIYKPVQVQFEMLVDSLNSFFQENQIHNNKQIILLGDFNIDFTKSDNRNKLLNLSIQFEFLFSDQTFTTDNNTQIDAILFNFNRKKFKIFDTYESYFSYHKALWAHIYID
jgi:exonuclease III